MKLRSLALTLILAFSVGCVRLPLTPKAPANLTPQVTNAFYATYAIKDLDIIRDFAVDASKTTPPVLSKTALLIVVNWHEATIKVIHASPGGWRAALSAGLDQLQTLMPAADYVKVLPFLNSAKILVTEVK